MRSIPDLWSDVRNAVLSDSRFQRWAAAFPLTQWIARRRASGLFDLCAGFVYAQVLAAVVELDLLHILATAPQTVSTLAPRLGLSIDATSRLLDAAASLELTERRRDGTYGVGARGAELLGNPSIATMVKHHAILYRDLADPVALLRATETSTELNRFWSYAHDHSGATATSDDVEGYSALMAHSLSMLVDDVLEAYSLEPHRVLLDVGGGEGAFVEAAATRFPRLSLRLFDLPPVAERASARLSRAGLSARVSVVPGDVFRDPLPAGADIVSLVRIVHDHDDPAARQILRAVHDALPPGGTLLLAEPMARTPGAEAVGDAYFGFYLLAMGQGRPRTEDELRELLIASGFASVEAVRTRRPMLVRMLKARRPYTSLDMKV